MAAVYLARDLKHDRLVALKVLHPNLAESLGADRFLRMSPPAGFVLTRSGSPSTAIRGLRS
jgi:hypothetical protein